MRHAWLVFAAACGSSNPDAPPDAAAERFSCAPRAAVVAAAYAHTTSPTGARGGSSCISGGCHLAGQLGAGATAFSFAGTLVKDLASLRAAGGIAVRIFGASGDQALAQAATDDAGNFVIRAPLPAFPYQVDTTACGASRPIRPMSSQLTSDAERSCNGAGICHGGTEGAIVFAD